MRERAALTISKLFGPMFSRQRACPATVPDPRSIEPFDDEAIERLTSIAAGYQTAEPYPHLVIDDFFNPECLDIICAEWPSPTAAHVGTWDDGRLFVNKKATLSKAELGLHTNFVLNRLGEPRFLEVLETVTGIPDLIPDPYRYGGGLHFTGVGGKLAIHADFNKHYKYKLDRRVNIIVYLTRGWERANGSCLELWDKTMTRCCKEIVPRFNRMVIFSTSNTSYHGHPHPVVGPESLLRRSIALYYYTNGRPESEAPEGEHETLWQTRAGAENYL